MLYVRDRLSGLGGTWKRRQRADVERYPIFKQQLFDTFTGKEAVDDIAGRPARVARSTISMQARLRPSAPTSAQRWRRAKRPSRRRS